MPIAFWTNHLSAFKPNGIPFEIDTHSLQYSTKKRALWVRASYSDIAKGHTAASATVPMAATTSAQGNDDTSADSGRQGDSNHTT
jgi:hypothetical protein